MSELDIMFDGLKINKGKPAKKAKPKKLVAKLVEPDDDAEESESDKEEEVKEVVPKKSKTPLQGNQAYCVKCKKNQKMKDAKPSKTKNNRNMIRGSCESCGCGMCKFVK